MRKLTTLVTAVALLGVLFAAGAPAASAATPVSSDPFLSTILKATNEYRAENGAGPLVWNQTASNGAQKWAESTNAKINKDALDMNKIHRPDAGRSILPKGYDMYSEVIAINNTAQQIVDWWINSPSHRAALLDKRATDMGIGSVKTTKKDYYGMTVAVANIAGYPSSRANQPQPRPTPMIEAGDVAAVGSNGSLFVYGSSKGNDMWQRKYVGSGWGNDVHMSVTDLNQDGFSDIVSVNKSGDLLLSKGQSNGTLKPQERIGNGWSDYNLVTSRWRNSDKYPGIIAQHKSSGDLFYYPRSSATTFAPRIKIGSGWRGLEIMAVDYKLDGKQDLLAKNTAGKLLLYRSNGKGSFLSEARQVVGTGWGSMTHISGIQNHLGDGSDGLLARGPGGNLLHYPLTKNGFGAKAQIGSSGWAPFLLGS